jgi:hypothetical protein
MECTYQVVFRNVLKMAKGFTYVANVKIMLDIADLINCWALKHVKRYISHTKRALCHLSYAPLFQTELKTAKLDFDEKPTISFVIAEGS